jgi:hypothetical protein
LARFLADLRANLIRGDAALEQRLQLDRWAYQPGLPDNVARPDPAAFAAVDRALAAYTGGGAVTDVPYAGWTTAERLRFVNGLPRTLAADKLAALDGAFRLSESGNAEVLFAWLQLALANRYQPAVAPAERFLTTQGRNKFVSPLFRTLYRQGDWGRPIATQLYARTRPLYHSVTQNAVDRALRGES